MWNCWPSQGPQAPTTQLKESLGQGSKALHLSSATGASPRQPLECHRPLGMLRQATWKSQTPRLDPLWVTRQGSWPLPDPCCVCCCCCCQALRWRKMKSLPLQVPLHSPQLLAYQSKEPSTVKSREISAPASLEVMVQHCQIKPTVRNDAQCVFLKSFVLLSSVFIIFHHCSSLFIISYHFHLQSVEDSHFRSPPAALDGPEALELGAGLSPPTPWRPGPWHPSSPAGRVRSGLRRRSWPSGGRHWWDGRPPFFGPRAQWIWRTPDFVPCFCWTLDGTSRWSKLMSFLLEGTLLWFKT